MQGAINGVTVDRWARPTPLSLSIESAQPILRAMVGLFKSTQIAGLTAQIVIDALMIDIWRRAKPYALPHHPDRGSSTTSEQFQRLMTDNASPV